MLANFEKRSYIGNERVWVGRYRNLNNLPHWHLECELIHIEEGCATVSNNNQKYTLHAGDAIFLDSGDIHYIKSDADCILSMALFDSSIIHGIQKKHRLKSALLTHPYPIEPCFSKIREELSGRKPFFELQICEYITSLMIQIFREEEILDRHCANENSSIANYKNLLDEIEEKCSYITFQDAAAFMGLSEPYFSRFFRKISGMTFSQYLNTVRLEKAIKLLQNNEQKMSMTEIADRCGFDTIRHFNRVFKDITGMSPRCLPADYTLDIKPIRTIQDAFNPTLQNSELL